jgi:hypothetical protein
MKHTCKNFNINVRNGLMNMLLPQDAQRIVENIFSRKNIEKKVLEDLRSSPAIVEKIEQGVEALTEWIQGDYYESKNKRLARLLQLDLKHTVEEILVVVLQLRAPTMLTSVVGQLAGNLNYSSKVDGIKTLAEILTILCEVDLFDIYKESISGILTVSNIYELDDETTEFINRTKYLPPMLCVPNKIKSNHDSGYLTVRDTMLLGKGNYHDGELCLDSINKFNAIPLSLDVRLLKSYEETSKKDLDTPEKEKAFNNMVRQSYRVYLDLIKQGNHFYLTHKLDKRGRTYSQGYHVNPQGASYKKAILNFHHEELIEGVY